MGSGAMMEVVRAKLRWIPAAAGGRKTPAKSPYSTVARFDESNADWPEVAWSIVAEFAEEDLGKSEMLATVRFLVAEASQELLHLGSQFQLFEGTRMMASGEVIGENCV
jgi:hypothetical protein